VTFATVSLARVAKSKVLREKTVVVQKHHGKGFQVIRATVDNPMLEVTVLPRTAGESFYVRVAIVPKRAKKGELKGTLTIETNEPGAAKLMLPITGTLL
jgi:hypothetical protein